MKYLIIVAIACLFNLIFSCKKEDEIHPIVGTWSRLTGEFTSCDIASDDYLMSYPCTANECYKTTFTSDGRIINEDIVGGNTFAFTGSYSISGKTISECLPSPCKVREFSISGSTLTITSTDTDHLGCLLTRVWVRDSK